MDTKPISRDQPAEHGRCVTNPLGHTEGTTTRGTLASVLTVCPFCACGCGLYLSKVDDELTGVMPSEHHPVSGGRLCARGWAAHEASLWGRRLTSPLVRNGGGRERTTWRTAVDAAVERIKGVLAAGRPIGVVGSARATNEENFLAVRLARGPLGTGHVDTCLRAPYQALVSGASEYGAGFNPDSALEDIERCDVILLLEGDLALTHPQVAFAIMKAVRNGARLVTLGAAMTQMSRLGWLHLPLVPGDELVLAARLAGLVESAPWEDTDSDSIAESRPNNIVPTYSHLMELAQLRTAVECYARASRAAIVLAPTGAAAPLLCAVGSGFARLAATSGHLHRPGSVFLMLPPRANSRGALEMGAAPNCLPGLSALEDPQARQRLKSVWGCDPTTQRGLDVEEMLGEVGGLIVLADDPPAALPSARAARAALAELDCLIVLDAFVTPTVLASHIALPIASPAEAFGSYTSMEGRVQMLTGCTAPRGEARPGWWVLSELTAALGKSKTYQSAADVFSDILAVVPRYRRTFSPQQGPPEGSPGVLSGVRGDAPFRLAETDDACESALEILAVPMTGAKRTSDFPFRLVRVGSFDWGDDTLVDSSPTLRRDHRSLRKLFPDGFVEMNARDANKLGIRSGRSVKVVAAGGNAVTPVRIREDLAPGLLLVPFAFRDQLEPVLKGGIVAVVNVERT